MDDSTQSPKQEAISNLNLYKLSLEEKGQSTHPVEALMLNLRRLETEDITRTLDLAWINSFAIDSPRESFVVRKAIEIASEYAIDCKTEITINRLSFALESVSEEIHKTPGLSEGYIRKFNAIHDYVLDYRSNDLSLLAERLYIEASLSNSSQKDAADIKTMIATSLKQELNRPYIDRAEKNLETTLNFELLNDREQLEIRIINALETTPEQFEEPELDGVKFNLGLG